MMQQDEDLQGLVNQANPSDLEELFRQAEEDLNMPNLQNTELRERIRHILKILRQRTRDAVENVIGTPEERAEYYTDHLHHLPKTETDDSIPGSTNSEA